MPITMNHTLKQLCELAGGEGGGAADPGIKMTDTLADIVADIASRTTRPSPPATGPELDASGAARDRVPWGPNFRGGRKKSKRKTKRTRIKLRDKKRNGRKTKNRRRRKSRVPSDNGAAKTQTHQLKLY